MDLHLHKVTIVEAKRHKGTPSKLNALAFQKGVCFVFEQSKSLPRPHRIRLLSLRKAQAEAENFGGMCLFHYYFQSLVITNIICIIFRYVIYLLESKLSNRKL